MHILRAALITATVVAGTAAIATPPAGTPAQPTIELPPALQRVLTDYEQAWQARDERALAALFTADGFVLSSGRPPVHGRADIARRYADSGGPLALRAFAYATADTLGYILGGYARERGAPDTGKFTLVVRSGADGRWSIVSDMDNGNSR